MVKLVAQGLVTQLLVHILVVVATTHMGILMSEMENALCEQQFYMG